MSERDPVFEDASTWVTDTSPVGRTVYARRSIEGREEYVVLRRPDRLRIQYLLDDQAVIGHVVFTEPGAEQWLAPLVARWLADGYTLVPDELDGSR